MKALTLLARWWFLTIPALLGLFQGWSSFILAAGVCAIVKYTMWVRSGDGPRAAHTKNKERALGGIARVGQFGIWTARQAEAAGVRRQEKRVLRGQAMRQMEEDDLRREATTFYRRRNQR